MVSRRETMKLLKSKILTACMLLFKIEDFNKQIEDLKRKAGAAWRRKDFNKPEGSLLSRPLTVIFYLNKQEEGEGIRKAGAA